MGETKKKPERQADPGIEALPTYGLTVLERLQLLEILPREGDFLTLQIVGRLRESLSFSEQEHKELGFKAAGDNRIAWSNEGKPKVVEIGPKAHTMVQAALRKFD